MSQMANVSQEDWEEISTAIANSLESRSAA